MRHEASRRRGSGFEGVYEEHVWRVYGFLSYRVRNRELAEDLTQATFERALRAWARFDPRRASEASWLLAIARNLLIDHWRRSRQAIDPVDERVLGASPGPEERFAASEELIDALSQLGQREREVIALRFGGDLNAPEIAAMLGLSVANVQQMTSRSLRILRTLLADVDPHERQPLARGLRSEDL